MTAVLQELVHIVRQAGNFNANAQVAPAALFLRGSYRSNSLIYWPAREDSNL
ncbi:MAG: hypothetical protein KDI01_00230 [Halioglobus sp.]|nr:hypothetical protein [Halioglobus sp.]